jgi:hypothetical protein
MATVGLYGTCRYCTRFPTNPHTSPMNTVLSAVLVSHNPIQPHLGLIRRHIEPPIMRSLRNFNINKRMFSFMFQNIKTF